MTTIHCTLEGFDANEAWQFSFNTPRELVRFLRNLGKGKLKRARIARILTIAVNA